MAPVPWADVTTEEAAAPVVAALRPVLLEPRPKGNLSLRSGKLKVELPSPTPKLVDITAKSRAYVVLFTAAPSHFRYPAEFAGSVVEPKANIVPAGITSTPPAFDPSCILIFLVLVSTESSPMAPVKLLFCAVVPRLNCNCVGIYISFN